MNGVAVLVALAPLDSRPAGAAIPWGNKWGNMPHRFQPISADLDLAETA
jgi:hypothetical protein